MDEDDHVDEISSANCAKALIYTLVPRIGHSCRRFSISLGQTVEKNSSGGCNARRREGGSGKSMLRPEFNCMSRGANPGHGHPPSGDDASIAGSTLHNSVRRGRAEGCRHSDELLQTARSGMRVLDSGGFFAPDHDGNSIPAWSSEIRLLFAHSAIFLYFSATI